MVKSIGVEYSEQIFHTKNLENQKNINVENTTTGIASANEKDSAETNITKDEINTINNHAQSAAAGAFDEDTTESVASAIAYLKSKYPYNDTGFGGDKYSMDNPQLKAFNEFINAGEMKYLAQSFHRAEAAEIISAVFPNIGIELSEDGSFSVPKGHGEEAEGLYSKFLAQMSQVDVSTPEIEALKAEIAEKSSAVEQNIMRINKLSQDILMLKQTIENEVNKAIETVEDEEENAKNQSKIIYKEELNAYINGEINYNEFKENVNSKLEQISPDISNAVAYMHSAEEHMKELEDYVDLIGTLNLQNENLRVDISSLTTDLEVKQAEANQKAEYDTDRTDPIGFKNSESVQFDFIIDRNNDGEFNNRNEFLGAEKGWAEMQELDTSGDGIVDLIELQEAQGLQVIVTNTDGSQDIKNIADVFKEGDSIDLNSFVTNGTKDENNNILAGTFNLNMNGEAVEGYQTFDTFEYLNNNYGNLFTDADKGINDFKQDYNPLINMEEIKVSDFDTVVGELKNKIAEGWQAVLNDDFEAEDSIANTISKTFRTEDKTITAANAATEVNDRIGINGELDEQTRQGKEGDCWLLTGLNALNATEKGKQIIRNSIIPNDDGSVTVRFAGANKEYTIQASEIKMRDHESGGRGKYSRGDNDMLVLELAYEKLRQETEGRNLYAGCPYEIIQAMVPNVEINKTHYFSEEQTYKMLQEALDGKGYIASSFLLEPHHSAKLTDNSTFSYNKDEAHAFAITNIDSDTVTFVNPWNSSVKYTMTWEEFAKLAPYSIENCNILKA